MVIKTQSYCTRLNIIEVSILTRYQLWETDRLIIILNPEGLEGLKGNSDSQILVQPLDPPRIAINY